MRPMGNREPTDGRMRAVKQWRYGSAEPLTSLQRTARHAHATAPMAVRFVLSVLRTTMVFSVLGGVVGTSQVRAWVFHEHAEIGRAALLGLNLEERDLLARAWDVLREGEGREGGGLERLCRHPLLPSDADPRNCIDAPMLSAIAADHSCDPQDMLAIVRRAPWLRA